MILARLKSWLRSVPYRSRLEREMDDELRFHIDERARALIRAGVGPTEAARRARIELGSIEACKEEMRGAVGLRLLDEFRGDLRYALRQLRRTPGFTTVAIVTLALGIGANTAMFSAVDAVLLRPQPYPQPDRLVNVFERTHKGGRNSVSGASFRDWRDHQTKFEALAIYANDQFDFAGRGEPEKIQALSVSCDFNRVLGVLPLLGRGFRPADEQVGGPNDVAMLMERFWRTRFGGSPSVIGDTLQLEGRSRTIIGVMPDGVWPNPRVAIVVPYVLTPNSFVTSHNVHRARVLGRLAAGTEPAQAESELNAIKQSLQDTYPAFKLPWGVLVQPMQQVLAQDSKPVLLLLFGAAVLVLLIACANVANLLLARASTRQREIAVRSALGASGGRIARQVITESLVLALLGGGAGVLLAATSIHLLGSLSADLLPATMSPQLDPRVLAFSLLASCGTGVLFGIFPAWSRPPDLNLTLKSGSRGTTDGGRARSQSSLIIAEVALTTILLVGTGLLLRGLVQFITTDPGINPKNVLMFDLTMPFTDTYQGAGRRMAFLERATDEIRAVPGVVSVATADDLPFGDGGQGHFFSLEEQPETRQERSGAIKYVSPDYFATLGATIVRGRPISARDSRASAPRVLVVNRTLVDVLFGTEDPIGRRLNVNDQSWEIVGVAADMRVDGLNTPVRPTFYAPHWQFPWGSAFLVRTQGNPLATVAAVATAIHRLDPNLPLTNQGTLERAMKDSLGPQELILNLVGTFAATALFLASIGLYGVMAYSVASRQRELSIRMALGADRSGVLRIIVSRGVRLTMIGLVLGLLGALATSRVLTNRLYGINAHDPLVFVGATLLLASVAFVACVIPARRATKVDPLVALRCE